MGLHYAPPFTFLTLRFTFGLPAWYPWCCCGAALAEDRVELGHIAVAGVLMHAVQLGGSHYAQYLGMSAGAAALIISSQPLATALIAQGVLEEKLAGAMARHLPRPRRRRAGRLAQDRHPRGDRRSLACTLVALAGVTAATLYQRRFAPAADLEGRLGDPVRRFAGDPCAARASRGRLPLALGWQLWAAIAFLVIFASILGVSVLYYLLRHGEATRVTSMMYLPPVFAVALEAALFGLCPAP